MKKKLAYFFAALIILASLFSVVAFADFGDYAGDSDWGWDSGSDYDWGDSGSDYNYSSSYGSSSDDSFTPGEIIGGAVVIAIIVAIMIARAKLGGSKNKRGTVNIPTTPTAPMVNNIAALKQKDPGFSEAKFLEDASNLYVRMQNAWTARNLEPLRTRLTAELYAKSDRQVQTYIQNHQTDHVDRISVLDSKIVGCTSDTVNDIVTVQLTARIVDYTTDDNTGNIVRGDKNRELFMTYQWTFVRTLGKTTGMSVGADDKHCPNCGAPIDLNQSAVCSYCGAVVTSGDYDWVVSNIKGISQKTN